MTGASDEQDDVEGQVSRRNEGDGSEGESSQSETGLDGGKSGHLDLDSLADELLPYTDDDGIFEVILPNGKKLGVAINVQGALTRLHLSPFDDQLGARLRNKRMELRCCLERRMGRSVELTVL